VCGKECRKSQEQKKYKIENPELNLTLIIYFLEGFNVDSRVGGGGRGRSSSEPAEALISVSTAVGVKCRGITEEERSVKRGRRSSRSGHGYVANSVKLLKRVHVCGTTLRWHLYVTCSRCRTARNKGSFINSVTRYMAFFRLFYLLPTPPPFPAPIVTQKKTKFSVYFGVRDATKSIKNAAPPPSDAFRNL